MSDLRDSEEGKLRFLHGFGKEVRILYWVQHLIHMLTIHPVGSRVSIQRGGRLIYLSGLLLRSALAQWHPDNSPLELLLHFHRSVQACSSRYSVEGGETKSGVLSYPASRSTMSQPVSSICTTLVGAVETRIGPAGVTD